MKKKNQSVGKRIWKNICTGILAMALLVTTVAIPNYNTEAGIANYTVNTSNITALQSLFAGVATVAENGESITITLTKDLNGRIVFDFPDEGELVLDAAGHSILAGVNNEAILLTDGNKRSIVLVGDGTYQSGVNNVVFTGSGSGGLIIESGTFVAAPSGGNQIINGNVAFSLAEGFDYYTVNTSAEQLFKDYNRQIKTSYSIAASAGTLVVAQHKGTVPSYDIRKMDTDHGSYTVKVNGVESSTAKPDDLITITVDPDTNYKLADLRVWDEDTLAEVYHTFGGSGNEYNFYMHDNIIAVYPSYVWQNQITTQPTAAKPTVVTNNPSQVTSYQWYKMVPTDILIVNGAAGENEQSVDFAFSGTYSNVTKRWSTDSFIHIDSEFSSGYQLVFSEITGTVLSCSGGLQADGTYATSSPSSNVLISFEAPGGSCKITLKKMVEVAIEGQTGATYNGPGGDVYCKVKFSNNETISSNAVSFKTNVEPNYVITAGANSVYKSDNMGASSITCSGPLEELTGIYVDGKLVAPSNYTLKSGSTILTFKEDYLKSLSAGTHLVNFAYGSTTVQTSFQVQKETVTPIKDDVPKTGDFTNLSWLIVLFLIGGAGLIYCKKKNIVVEK